MRLDDDNNLNAEEGNAGGFGFGGGGGGLGGFGGGSPLGGLAFAFLPMLFSRLGCLGTAILLGVLFFFGAPLLNSLGGAGGGSVGSTPAYQQSGPDRAAPPSDGGSVAQVCGKNSERRLSCNVMANANETWARLMPGYTQPGLHFYSGNDQSGCGSAQSAMGPFYCPADRKVYLDTSFYDELRTRFGAPGQFAEGYVVAHEIGHHIQNLQGISDRVSAQQQRVGRTAGNALSVKLELQADCYAGVWAANARKKDGSKVLEDGDIQSGMTAAQAIGDDTLQRESQGRVVPDSFTHGTSAQRQMWLKRGLDSGDMRQCDTFAEAY